MKPRPRVLLVILCAVGCSFGAGPKDAAIPDSRLEGLLARLARVARLYRDMALKFECTETIDYRAREDWQPSSGYVKFSYLYERDAKGKFEDCRLWRKFGGSAGHARCVNPDEYRIPLYLSNAYLWIFAFLEERQPWHEYRIVGEETVLGRPSVVVEYGPGSVIRAGLNDWYGRAWIDRESSQLLKVQAYRPEYWVAKRRVERASQEPADDRTATREYEVEWVLTEFDTERNGMRFVSEVQLHRARYREIADYKEEKLIDVRQTYTSYRFFRVASRDEVKGIVEGKALTATQR